MIYRHLIIGSVNAVEQDYVTEVIDKWFDEATRDYHMIVACSK